MNGPHDLNHEILPSARDGHDSSQPHLSEREHQVLLLASKGQTDHAIANVLGISFATVGTYWSRIRGKLGPYNRTELVAKFVRARAGLAVDLLKSQNAGLLAEVQEKAASLQAVRDGMAMFESVLQSAPDGIIVVDDEGTIQYANLAAKEMFGYSPGELIGKHVRILVPDELQIEHANHRKNFMANPSRRRMGEHHGTPARRKDGSQFPALITLNTTKTETKTFVICIIRKLEE